MKHISNDWKVAITASTNAIFCREMSHTQMSTSTMMMKPSQTRSEIPWISYSLNLPTHGLNLLTTANVYSP